MPAGEVRSCPIDPLPRSGACGRPHAVIDVISPHQVRRRHDGIDAHACTNLLPRDITVCDLIPCTSAALTLLHLAAVTSDSAFRGAVEQAEIRRLFDLRAIEDVLDRFAGHRGTRRLREAVSAIGGGEAISRNDFEARFLPLTRQMSLSPPQTDVWMEVAGIWHELDCYWPDLGLAVEMDGLETHGTRSGRRRDRAKDRRLATVGIQVIRFIWEDLDHPATVMAEVEAVAAQRRRERMKAIASPTSSVSVSSAS